MVIGGAERPYLLRWHLTPWSAWFRTGVDVAALPWWQRVFRRLPNVYLHKIVRSDDDRALHCHPWANASLILWGGYVEVVPFSQGQAALDDHHGRIHRIRRRPGQFIRRAAGDRHRLEVARPCWSLFITGPKHREWGFYCKHGFVHWRVFCDPADPYGHGGRGCAE